MKKDVEELYKAVKDGAVIAHLKAKGKHKEAEEFEVWAAKTPESSDKNYVRGWLRGRGLLPPRPFAAQG